MHITSDRKRPQAARGRRLARAVRASCFAAAIGAVSAGAADAQTAEDDDIVVTLLGTGTPGLYPDRYSAATLVQAGGLDLLFDAGRGATLRIGQAGLAVGDIDATFLTHFHSDHVSGLADVFMTGYIGVPTIGGRKEPFQLYGPVGTQQLADGILTAHQWDIETRIADAEVPEPATRIVVHEAEDAVAMEQNGVKVTVFPVRHGDKITHAVGYRIDYKTQAVLISGDTVFDPNVVEHSRDADLVIHEVAMASEEAMKRPSTAPVLAHHITPEDAGRVFAEAQPDFAVYTHMVLLGAPPISELIRRTRTTYQGPLVIGKDLMQFVLSDDGTVVGSAGD